MGLEGKEAVKEVKSFIDKARRCPTCKRAYADILITDVPKKTLEQWKEFANSDEFSCRANKGGHWGFALKWLIDFYLGAIGKGFERTEAKADMALEEIAELKSEGQEKEKTIKMVNNQEKVIK